MPPVAESGYPGFEAATWVGMLAPAGTPEAIVRRPHRETEGIVAQSDMRTRLVDMGFIVVAGTSAAFGAQIRDEITKKGKLVLASGAKPNQEPATKPWCGVGRVGVLRSAYIEG